MSTRDAKVKITRTWTRSWSVGDALWAREGEGLSCLVLVSAPEFGPRGGYRRAGQCAEITGPTLASVNRALRGLGFHPTTLRLRDIAVAA